MLLYQVNAFEIGSDIASWLDIFLYTGNWGVHGRVVKVVDFKPLAPRRCGFGFRQGLWIISIDM
jgi:hypothetical protein